ncbi:MULTISPECIES: serine O-acetyltransferase [Rhodococcus]|uniref:serine O-acetyltransferase n=1 Tax=Rhodococcus TaxID=1827 RepID=UPI0002D222A5|nr:MULTISPECIES: serine acetyltransferase [Rhodococcus]PND53801.1 serine acetyltransferase [Rhodococcus sp. ENV425]CCW10914.1 Serine acetyltransferase [Rhodococcus aetherivorans]
MTRSLTVSVFQDWAANAGNPKARIVLVTFRLAHALRSTRYWRINPAVLLVGVVYRVMVEWILGIEIPWKTKIGPNFVVYHGIGIVINDGTIIGRGVTLRHNVTLGTKTHGGPAPRIEDDVEIGASAIIIGDITIGRGAVVGAGAVVSKDVPAGAVVVGNPAQIVSGSQVAAVADGVGDR